MDKHLAGPSSLAALGGLLLALGILVYLADRQPGHALLLPAWPRLGGGPWFGARGPGCRASSIRSLSVC